MAYPFLAAPRYMCPIQLLVITGHLYLRGMWLGAYPKYDSKYASVLKRLMNHMLKICSIKHVWQDLTRMTPKIPRPNNFACWY